MHSSTPERSRDLKQIYSIFPMYTLSADLPTMDPLLYIYLLLAKSFQFYLRVSSSKVPSYWNSTCKMGSPAATRNRVCIYQSHY
jgi:hypothetical protein